MVVPSCEDAACPAEAGGGLLQLSDVHLRAVESPEGLKLDEDGSLLFPGPRQVHSEEERVLLRRLFGLVSCSHRREFSVRLQQPLAIFRVQRVETAVDGVWFRLRRSSTVAPTLQTLPSRLPAYIEQMLLSSSLCGGGLILVCGQPGSGKTTTASAIITSRLHAFGGFAYTIEDPPEILALNGWHGSGYCTQTEVYEGAGGWEESIKDLLRSQPVGARLMLYVGEVRTAEAARMLVRAASNGFLVVTTTFASDLISGIDTLYQLLGADYTLSLSQVLRVVLYQRLRSEPVRSLEAVALGSESGESRVAVLIRSRQLGQLKDELVYQVNQHRRLQAGATSLSVQ
ncbi:MAG: GspE family protein [Rhodocyclaceae bacterium]|nr:GspE family protein [Rhodocyclaceae bacterium]